MLYAAKSLVRPLVVCASILLALYIFTLVVSRLAEPVWLSKRLSSMSPKSEQPTTQEAPKPQVKRIRIGGNVAKLRLPAEAQSSALATIPSLRLETIEFKARNSPVHVVLVNRGKGPAVGNSFRRSNSRESRPRSRSPMGIQAFIELLNRRAVPSKWTSPPSMCVFLVG